jgi:hypothetical protein
MISVFHHMKNATRNRLLYGVQLLTAAAMSAVVIWVYFKASKDHAGPILSTVVIVAFWIMFMFRELRLNRSIKKVETLLLDAGIKPPDETPIPIKLAEDRESLIAGIIALAIIIFVFCAYYGGWFAHWRMFRNM